MSLKTVTGVLAAAVADAGTFTVGYPAGTSRGDYIAGVDHRLVMNQIELKQPSGFTISFGATTATITNRTGASWPIGSPFIMQLEMPAGVNRVSKTGLAMVRARAIAMTLLTLGSPAAAVTNGISASQSVSADASFLLNGSLLANSRMILDVPRNVVAAWTGTAILTITGKDEYGNTMVEKTASTTAHTGKKAFKEITSITSNASITGATVGTGNVLGLPVFVTNKSEILAELQDDVILGGNRNKMFITYPIADISADATYYVPVPVAGKVTKISTVINGAVGTADVTITPSVNASAITGGVVTIATSGSAAGDLDSAVPTAANTVAVTDYIKLVVAGGGSGGTPGATVIIEITPTHALNGTLVGGSVAKESATSDDVRGTYAPTTVPDGTIGYALLAAVSDPDYLGGVQYTG